MYEWFVCENLTTNIATKNQAMVYGNLLKLISLQKKGCYCNNLGTKLRVWVVTVTTQYDSGCCCNNPLSRAAYLITIFVAITSYYISAFEKKVSWQLFESKDPLLLLCPCWGCDSTEKWGWEEIPLPILPPTVDFGEMARGTPNWIFAGAACRGDPSTAYWRPIHDPGRGVSVFLGHHNANINVLIHAMWCQIPFRLINKLLMSPVMLSQITLWMLNLHSVLVLLDGIKPLQVVLVDKLLVTHMPQFVTLML